MDCMLCGYLKHGCGSKLRLDGNKPGDKTERGLQELLLIGQSYNNELCLPTAVM